MWRLTGDLPATAKLSNPVPIARIRPLTHNGLATIAALRPGVPPNIADKENHEVIMVLPSLDTETYSYTIDLSNEEFTAVNSIASNGQTFYPAKDLSNPQPGEFIYNPYTYQLTIYAISSS